MDMIFESSRALRGTWVSGGSKISHCAPVPPRSLATLGMTPYRLHLPDHRKNQRPATHGLSEIALERGPHLLLKQIGIAQLIRGTFGKHANQLFAQVVEHVLRRVDMDEPAGNDLRLPNELPGRIDRDHDDHEAILGEMLPIADDDFRHLFRLPVDEYLPMRDSVLEDPDRVTIDLGRLAVGDDHTVRHADAL